jgi:hypothetical protein
MSVLSADLQFSEGSSLLTRWQAGDDAAQNELRMLFDAVIEGQYDAVFQEPAPTDSVCVTTSLHMTTLTLLNQLYGLTSVDFYKGDPQRYVRTTLMTQRLLGIRRLTLHWPTYALGAECLGQVTMYPEKHAPSTNSGEPLIDKTNWRELGPPNLDNDVFRVMEDMLACFSDLTNLEPVAHLPAPYSLAADIFGLKAMILSLVKEPDFVDELLAHLTDQVFVPWCEHLARVLPKAWIELSDASGSPILIGPRRFMKTAARPVHRLINNYPWGDRIFVSNYRGDTPLKTSGGGQGLHNNAADGLTELIDFKLSLCPEFIIKLDADHAPVSFYVDHAIQRGKPLYLGIGATRINRNSIVDHEAAKRDLGDLAANYSQAIKTVSKALADKGYSRSDLVWPGDVYIEDINAESDFDLVKTIVESIANHGKVGS